jgi:hypothetical protein
MVEGGGGARFGSQPQECALVVGEVFGHEFQRDLAAEPHVFSAVHNSHAAGTELPQDPVMGKRLSDHWCLSRSQYG